MKIDLAGKVALVTASTAGIGFAIAKGLAESGAEVILNGRSEQSVNAAIARLQNEVPGAKARPAIADLSDADGAAQLLRAVTGVDILVNNAGIYGPQDFYATDDATWDNYWQTNVMSGVRLSRGLLPAMVSKGWGRVVFISSESARNIPADMIHYGVTKTAQLSLARGLAKYVAGSGVTVNSVSARANDFRRLCRNAERRSGENRSVAGGTGESVCHDPSSELGDPAGGLGGRGRQYGGLRLLAAGVSHLRRRAARRRRRGG